MAHILAGRREGIRGAGHHGPFGQNISPRADGDLAIVGYPSGTTGGGLAGTSPVDLLVSMRRELVARTGMDPGRVEDVIIERVAS